MTDRRSFDRNRDQQSFSLDREVIIDLCLKKRLQGDCDRKNWGARSLVTSSHKTENNIVQIPKLTLIPIFSTELLSGSYTTC